MPSQIGSIALRSVGMRSDGKSATEAFAETLWTEARSPGTRAAAYRDSKVAGPNRRPHRLTTGIDQLPQGLPHYPAPRGDARVWVTAVSMGFAFPFAVCKR